MTQAGAPAGGYCQTSCGRCPDIAAARGAGSSPSPTLSSPALGPSPAAGDGPAPGAVSSPITASPTSGASSSPATSLTPGASPTPAPSTPQGCTDQPPPGANYSCAQQVGNMFVVGHFFSGALLDRMLRPLGLIALCRPHLDSAMQHSWLAWDPRLVATVRQHVGAAQGYQQRLWGAHRLVQPAQAPHLRFAQAPLLQLE